eukprot:746063-Hanusia_phi.AAC.5
MNPFLPFPSFHPSTSINAHSTLCSSLSPPHLVLTSRQGYDTKWDGEQWTQWNGVDWFVEAKLRSLLVDMERGEKGSNSEDCKRVSVQEVD